MGAGITLVFSSTLPIRKLGVRPANILEGNAALDAVAEVARVVGSVGIRSEKVNVWSPSDLIPEAVARKS